MKKKVNLIIKIGLILVASAPIIFSIVIDLLTYNVIFPTDDSLFVYVLKGIAFNWKKCLPPLIIYIGVKIYESKIVSTRQRDTKSRNNENINISQK